MRKNLRLTLPKPSKLTRNSRCQHVAAVDCHLTKHGLHASKHQGSLLHPLQLVLIRLLDAFEGLFAAVASTMQLLQQEVPLTVSTVLQLSACSTLYDEGTSGQKMLDGSKVMAAAEDVLSAGQRQ